MTEINPGMLLKSGGKRLSRPAWLISCLTLTLTLSSAEFGENPKHTEMPPVPQAPGDYESMWDPFALRGREDGAALQMKPESSSVVRLTAGFDEVPWNGRQIARDGHGNWFVLAEGKQGSIFLASGPGTAENPYRPRGGDFASVELTGRGKTALIQVAGAVSRASMAFDGDESLHIVFHQPDGLWHVSAKTGGDAISNLRDKAVWTVPRRLVEGPCRAGDIMRDAAGKVVLSYSQKDTVYYRALDDENAEVAGGRGAGMPSLRQFTSPPPGPEDDAVTAEVLRMELTKSKIPLSECESQDAVMDLAPDGSVWLAFRRDFAIWVAHRNPEGRWSPPELAVREYAFHPSLLIDQGRPLITFLHDGLRKIPLDLEGDIRKRAGGGSAIGYATLTDEGWRTGEVARSEEIVVHRRGMWAKRGTGKLLPQIEQLGWPVLFRDGQGVAWALWQNTTRRWSYSARWLGEDFGEVQECRGPFNAPRLPVNAEKQAPAGAKDAGLVFYAAAGAGEDRILFDRLLIPSLSVENDREIVFLDSLEIAATSGVDLILNEMKKPSPRPSLSPKGNNRVVIGPSVTKHGDTYVMRYSGSFEGGGESRGLAMSRDGLHFEMVDELPADLADAEVGPTRPLDYWKGTEETRAPLHYPNPDISDPAKKFIRLGFSTEARGSYWIEYSPDGKIWTKGPETTAPEVTRERAQPRFFDATDPERPIRVYSRVYTETGRSWGTIWTKDLWHWSGMEHLLDADDPYGRTPEMDIIGNTGKAYTMRGQIFLDAVAGKGEDEIYAASVRKAEGLYFCFYWPGYGGRPLTDVGLAVSRDGFNFTRVKNGERILPLGPPGAWDSGYIFQMSPMIDGDTVRAYYRATSGRREGTDGFEHNLTEIGLATIRVNGWTYYTPREGEKSGTVTTIPIQVPKSSDKGLTVNIEGVGGQEQSFAVEILDAATNEVLPGYGASDCVVPGEGGIAVPIAWNEGAALPGGREIRLRFYLNHPGVRLYSFGFR